MQHLQSLSRRFSKFDTKFNVNSLFNRHSAVELRIAKKLNQISHSNFLQQVINHIHLWLLVIPSIASKHMNCEILWVFLGNILDWFAVTDAYS